MHGIAMHGLVPFCLNGYLGCTEQELTQDATMCMGGRFARKLVSAAGPSHSMFLDIYFSPESLLFPIFPPHWAWAVQDPTRWSVAADLALLSHPLGGRREVMLMLLFFFFFLKSIRKYDMKLKFPLTILPLSSSMTRSPETKTGQT